MPNVRNVTNVDGDDISDLVNDAAARASVDAVALLALLKAESNLDPRAERWGSKTAEAQAAIASQNLAALAAIINATWPDISFGMSQRIVMYHDVGDRLGSVVNCLYVRDAVFNDPAEDIRAAARRLASGIERSDDGTALGGMIVYNAGSDKRGDPEWLRMWGRNVASYQAALEWAAGFAAEEAPAVTPEFEWENALNVINGIAGQLSEYGKQLADVRDIITRLRA